MRRLAAIALSLAAAGALLPGAVVAGDDDKQRYVVELDNAFGLIEGADLKVAGVRAGKITSMDLDPRSYRALIEIDIKEKGFGSLRKDVFCESRPQSLIGEYYLDCLPGKSSEVLEPGSRIPVEQTGSTVPVDLVNNIMRRPFRERFSILLSELGVAFAARGEDLNETIRRLSPALREVDKVLAILAEQRTVIRDLTANADTVITRLADNRGDVSRFFVEARDTSKASAARAQDLRRQFQRLPTFLRGLRLTMIPLGEAAEAQIPALRNLNRASGQLTTFLDTLAEFTDASRPSLRSLAGAARAGSPALRAANPRISELRTFAAQAPETATNLALTLEDLDDPNRAVEDDYRAPPGQKGFSGLQAILQYVFNQSQSVNLFDDNGYLLKASVFADSTCTPYTDAAQAQSPTRDKCAAILGPRRPGINEPDPSIGAPGGAPAAAAARAAAQDAAVLEGAAAAAPSPGQAAPAAPASGAAAAGRQQTLAGTLGSVLGGRLPALPLPAGTLPAGAAPPAPARGGAQSGLLDYLLAP